MDFLDPKKRRAHEKRLFAGYFLIGIALLLLTSILFFQATGYDVDRKTGAIIQNGLVFVDAHPESATIRLNGQPKGQTDNRLVLPAGAYDLELNRDGYRTWKKSFTLGGSTIERFVYAFLFPSKLEPKDLRALEVPAGVALQSPDRRWLLVQQSTATNAFTVTDLNSEEDVTTAITIPVEIMPATGQSELVEWSSDNRHVVLKHSADGVPQFIIIDRENPGSSVNLTSTFAGTPFDAIRLRDKKFDQYFLHDTTTGTLQTAELRTRAVAPFAANIIAFQPHGDNEVLYVTNEGSAEGKVFVRLRSGSDNYTLKEIAAAPKYLIDLARFEGAWFVAIGATNDPRIYIYKNPADDLRRKDTSTLSPFTTLRIDSPEYLSFSANTRFIGVQSGKNFAVYDAETKRQYKYERDLPLTPGQKATWMDGHRYALVSQNKLYVFDFDGTNQQELIGMYGQYLPFYDRDYDFLYTLSPSVANPAAQAIVRTPMRITADQ